MGIVFLPFSVRNATGNDTERKVTRMAKLARWSGPGIPRHNDGKGYSVRRFTSPKCTVGLLMNDEERYLKAIRKNGQSIIKDKGTL